MKIFKVGDQVQSICAHCQSIKTAHFQLRDVPLSDGSGTVKNVLVGVCDTCAHVIVTPQQSAPAIHRQIQQQRRSVEARVPAHFVDIIHLASSRVGGETNFSSVLLKYYVHALARNDEMLDRLPQYLQSELAQGIAQKRISLKGRYVADELSQIQHKAHLANTTETLKAIVLKINDEILLNPQGEKISELRQLAAAFN